jgi:spermidine/putrescine transport system permease protein
MNPLPHSAEQPRGRVIDPVSSDRTAYWLLTPGVLWSVGFLFIPLMVVCVISFAMRGTYGGVIWQFSLENYRDLWHVVYARIFGQSLVLASLTTVVCLLMGFPLAYYIGRLSPRWQAVWLLLIMIPFWTNFLVRTYAWMFILRTEGLLNTVLLGLDVITTPVELLYTDKAVLIGLVYGYLPFMVLPLYATLERLDPAVIEAARDLYADPWSVFWRVIVPLAKPGIIAGCILVFIPSLGAFLTPDLLGGARNMMIGNLIQHEYLVARDWPLGSAISLILMIIVIASVAAYFFVESTRSRKGVES